MTLTEDASRVAPPRRGLRLGTAYPQLLAMAHPTRNGELDVGGLSAGSGRKVWWRCPAGDDHEWDAKICNMTRPGAGCPYCLGRRISSTNRLSTTHPDLAGQWHPTRNGDRTAADVVAGCNDRIWWQCPTITSHAWQAQIVSRANAGNGCPYCGNKMVSDTNSLAAMRPDLAVQWHPTRNGTLTPSDVTAGGVTRVWWQCVAGPDHEWRTTVVQRTRTDSGCPCCVNQKISVTNSLATRHPDIAVLLDVARNGGRTADQVITGSNAYLWWRCPVAADHIWRAQVRSLTGDGTGCPACSGNQVSQTNSLATRFPHIAAQWHPTLNPDLSPEQLTAYSNQPVWWLCPVDQTHSWKVAPNSRASAGTGCPYCTNRKVAPSNALSTRYPHLVAHLDPTRNNGLTADDIMATSTRVVVWSCPAGPDHVWSSPVSYRTGREDAGCPCCAGRVLSTTNCLASTRPDLAAQWHPTSNGTRTPNDVIATSSTDRVWWRCDKGPDHEWRTAPHTRTVVGTGCPFCSRKALSVTNALTTVRPDIAAQWHPTLNGDVTPDRVICGAAAAYWWHCERGPDHVWRVSVNKRTGDETGCPCCANWQVSVTNSLAMLYPDVAASLDPDLNDGITADQVIARSDRKLWWRCPAAADHIWPARVYSRTINRSGCPACRGMRLSSTNSLAMLAPDIAAELDPTLNAGRTADQVLAGTNEKLTWRCRNDPVHIWVASPSNRTWNGHGCPSCAVTGYRPTLAGYLYLLRREVDGVEQRKVGVTNVPKQRLRKLRRSGWEPLEVSTAMDGAHAYRLERAVIAVLVSRGLRRTKTSPLLEREDGYTEMWEFASLPASSLAELAEITGEAIG